MIIFDYIKDILVTKNIMYDDFVIEKGTLGKISKRGYWVLFRTGNSYSNGVHSIKILLHNPDKYMFVTTQKL